MNARRTAALSSSWTNRRMRSPPYPVIYGHFDDNDLETQWRPTPTGWRGTKVFLPKNDAKGAWFGVYRDGGNRTRVRGRAKGGIYERSRRSDLVLGSARRRGCRGPAPEDVPGLAGANLTRVSLLSDPGNRRRRLAGAETSGLAVAKRGGRARESPHLLFSRVFYEAARDLDSQPPPPRTDHVEACRPLGVCVRKRHRRRGRCRSRARARGQADGVAAGEKDRKTGEPALHVLRQWSN